jgi:hypothetical protein
VRSQTKTGSTRSSGAHRLALLVAALGGLPSTVMGAELVTARPHAFVVGDTRGSAVAPGVDISGSHHALALPGMEAARVTWQRHVPGGIGANLLIDGEGRIFAAGLGRVTQLGADGALQFSQLGGFSSALAAALLADGSRAILTREGRVLAWSAQGALTFDVSLEAPPPQSSSSLLPLPDGGVLASVGEWLFDIDATRGVRSHASLPASIQHVLLRAGRALLVDDQGRVFEWNRRALPRRVGAFTGPLAAAMLDGEALLGVTAQRSVERLDPGDGGLRELARLDPPGASALASFHSGRWAIMKSDGSWFVLQGDAPAPASGQRTAGQAPNQLDLLADSTGTVVWWAADVPLHLETSSGVGRELAEVRCATPISLVPAGRSRLVAACTSGTIWLVGPDSLQER